MSRTICGRTTSGHTIEVLVDDDGVVQVSLAGGAGATAAKQDDLLAAVRGSRGGVAVTLGADFVTAAPCRLWVGTGGDVKVDLENATGLTYKNVPSGTELPVLATKVYSTANGTNAADIVTLP
mgnify:CR=1 FL=1